MGEIYSFLYSTSASSQSDTITEEKQAFPQECRNWMIVNILWENSSWMIAITFIWDDVFCLSCSARQQTMNKSHKLLIFVKSYLTLSLKKSLFLENISNTGKKKKSLYNQYKSNNSMFFSECDLITDWVDFTTAAQGGKGSWRVYILGTRFELIPSREYWK